MTNSESKALGWLKRWYPEGYFKKLPDYKQTGSGMLRGLPDYLVIWESNTYWYEIKMVKSKKTFNLSEINDYQWIEFEHMTKAGAQIWVLVLDGDNNWHKFSFENLSRRAKNGETSIKFHVDEL